MNHKWQTNVMQAAYICREAWDNLANHCDNCEEGCINGGMEPGCKGGELLAIGLDEASDQLIAAATTDNDVYPVNELINCPIYGAQTEWRERGKKQRALSMQSAT